MYRQKASGELEQSTAKGATVESLSPDDIPLPCPRCYHPMVEHIANDPATPVSEALVNWWSTCDKCHFEQHLFTPGNYSCEVEREAARKAFRRKAVCGRMASSGFMASK